MALIGLGSNIDPVRHLKTAAGEIRREYPDAVFSHVYRSRPVGMAGEHFLNACCRLRTGLGASELVDWLKSLEREAGREPIHDPWKPRTLDLDLLMLGERTLDEGLVRYGHVRIPAMELVELPLEHPGQEEISKCPSIIL